MEKASLIAPLLRLISLAVLLTFSSEQIVFACPPSLWRALPVEASFRFSSEASRMSKAQETGILGQFSGSENPYPGDFAGVAKTSLLKQAGWFKKLFKKIKKFFQKIIRKIVKVLIKVAKALQRFLNTGFGKVVGFIFGGPILLAALNFAINTFSYLGEGDVKGLFKYWGQNALTIASIALMFIPGVGQAIGMALQFVGKFLQVAGAFLASAGQLLGSALGNAPILGSVFGKVAGALNFAGGFLEGFGGSLVSQGRALVQRSNEIFRNLKEQGFKNITERLKQDLGLSSRERPLPKIEINPRIPEVKLPGAGSRLADYTRYFQASAGRVPRNTNPLQAQIEKAITEALLVIVGGGRIDKRGESQKITNALEGILQTVVHAGVEALKQRFVNQFAPSSSSSPLESADVRAPPPNLPQIQRGQGQSSRITSPHTGDRPLFSRSPSGYAFAHNGNGRPPTYKSPHAPYPQKLEHLGDDRYRNIGDEGRIDEFRQDGRTGSIKSTEEIGNLPGIPHSGNSPFILGREAQFIDFNASQANLRAAFSVHENLADNNFFSNLNEYITVKGRQKIVDKALGSLFRGGKAESFVVDLTGIKDIAKEGLLPKPWLTNVERNGMAEIGRKFFEYIQRDVSIGKSYQHIAFKYSPTLTEQIMNRVLQSAKGLIPFFGELNIDSPKPGEIVHIVNFLTRTANGYLHSGRLQVTYGEFLDRTGRYRKGAVQAYMVVYQSNLPDDLLLRWGLKRIAEYHKKVPFL